MSHLGQPWEDTRSRAIACLLPACITCYCLLGPVASVQVRGVLPDCLALPEPTCCLLPDCLPPYRGR